MPFNATTSLVTLSDMPLPFATDFKSCLVSSSCNSSGLRCQLTVTAGQNNACSRPDIHALHTHLEAMYDAPKPHSSSSDSTVAR